MLANAESVSFEHPLAHSIASSWSMGAMMDALGDEKDDMRTDAVAGRFRHSTTGEEIRPNTVDWHWGVRLQGQL